MFINIINKMKIFQSISQAKLETGGSGIGIGRSRIQEFNRNRSVVSCVLFCFESATLDTGLMLFAQPLHRCLVTTCYHVMIFFQRVLKYDVFNPLLQRVEETRRMRFGWTLCERTKQSFLQMVKVFIILHQPQRDHPSSNLHFHGTLWN